MGNKKTIDINFNGCPKLFKVPSPLIIYNYENGGLNNWGDYKGVALEPIEYIVLSMIYPLMQSEVEYTIRYPKLLGLLGVTYKHNSTEPLGKDIRYAIEELSEKGLFNIIKINSQYAVITKGSAAEYSSAEMIYFHQRELRLLLDGNISYSTKEKILQVLMLIKFKSLYSVNERGDKFKLFKSFKMSMATNCGLKTVKTINRCLDILSARGIISVIDKGTDGSGVAKQQVIIRSISEEREGIYNQALGLDYEDYWSYSSNMDAINSYD